MNDDDLKNKDPFEEGITGRDITVGVETSYNIPPMEILQADLANLNQQAELRRQRIRGFRKEIKKQREEKAELLALVEDPGIYDSEACAKGAERCEEHITMFEATIAKEQAGVEQLDGMIKTIEHRICLKGQMSQ
jgi:hypothetical protein